MGCVLTGLQGTDQGVTSFPPEAQGGCTVKVVFDLDLEG